MYITIPEVSSYLDSLYRPISEELQDLRTSCEMRQIPIILKDAEELLLNLIRLKKPINLLEIGTAVGYSSICFASSYENTKITTLELRETSAVEARENIKKFHMEHRIEVICADAKDSLKLLSLEIEKGKREAFDMVFIDGAKGHYREFWDEATKVLAKDAVIISDNVLFKAITASDDFLDTRRNGTIMRRMRSFLTYITSLPNVNTSVLPVGDGIAISLLGKQTTQV